MDPLLPPGSGNDPAPSVLTCDLITDCDLDGIFGVVCPGAVYVEIAVME